MLASNLEVLFFSCPVETPLTIRSSNDVASRNSSSKACWIRFRSVLSIVTAYTCSVRCIHLLSEVGHNLRWGAYIPVQSLSCREDCHCADLHNPAAWISCKLALCFEIVGYVVGFHQWLLDKDFNICIFRAGCVRPQGSARELKDPQSARVHHTHLSHKCLPYQIRYASLCFTSWSGYGGSF